MQFPGFCDGSHLRLFSIPAWSVGFQPISPEELKMTGNAKAPGAPAIILFREVARDGRGRTVHGHVFVRKNRAAKHFSDLIVWIGNRNRPNAAKRWR